MSLIGHYRHLLAPCILVASIGIIITFLLHRDVKQSKVAYAQEQVAAQSQLNLNAISHEIDIHLAKLNALKSFISLNGGVTKDQFYEFTNSLLKQHDSAHTVEWISVVHASGRSTFEASVEKNEFPNFSITERKKEGAMVPAKGRETYYPVHYVNPLHGNETAIGFDLGSDPARKHAMDVAASKGIMQVSEPIMLVQSAQQAVLVFDPVFRSDTKNEPKRLLGFAVLVLRISNVIETASQNFNSIFSIQASDVSAPEDRTSIYSAANGLPVNATTEFSSVKNLAFLNRTWQLEFQPSPTFLNEKLSGQYIIFTIGFIGTLFATLAFGFYLARRAQGNILHHEQKAVAEFQALIETAVDAIITISPSGDIDRFNPAAEKMFGYKKAEVVEKNVKMLMPSDIASKHDHYLSDYELTGHKKIIGIGRTVTGRRKDGSLFPMDLSVGELHAPGKGYVGIIRDVTERSQYEAQILEHSRELARSNEDLSQFAYVASHDLKAPLRGIDNLAHWIDEKIRDHMDDECKTYMDLLKGRISRLETLLTSLLDYSRISTGERTLQSVDLNVVMDEAREILLTPGFSITFAKLPTIRASETEMSLLFQNLLSNAIKHHDKESGHIQLEYRSLENAHEFSIHDDGPGIPDDMHQKVFTMFQTLKPRDHVEGSGMGLAFVKKIIERNNATIRIAKSKLGRGSAFIISWPIKKGDELP